MTRTHVLEQLSFTYDPETPASDLSVGHEALPTGIPLRAPLPPEYRAAREQLQATIDASERIVDPKVERDERLVELVRERIKSGNV
jgi:hypothetical protein